MGVQQRGSAWRKRVADDLAVPSRTRQPNSAQLTQVMADEVLSAGSDPGEIAYAQLVTVAQRERDHQPRRVTVELADRHPVVVLEDLLAEEQPEGWQALTRTLGARLTLAGDV